MWKLLTNLVNRMKNNWGKGPGEEDITAQLNQGGNIDQASKDRLAALLYPELKSIASVHMRRERSDHTWQATALVNELYLNLLRRTDVTWTSRNHFLLAAAQAMRLLLVDHARARDTQKRGGGWSQLEMDEKFGVDSAKRTIEVLELDQLLTRLAAHEPRMASVVELRFFGGLTFKEIGSVLGLDERTAKRDWSLARTWLRGQLESNESSGVGEN